MIAARLECRASFAGPARYVLEQWAADLGEPVRFVGRGEPAELLYGGEGLTPDDAFAAALERDEVGERPDPADPVATAFWFLSGLEEAASPRDAWGRVRPPERDLLELPVDDAYDRLSALVSRRRTPLLGPPFAIALSHDVDALRLFGTAPLARLVYRSLRTRSAREVTGAAAALLRRRDPYRDLRGLCALERAHGARSTFYFLGAHSDALDGPDGAHYERTLPAAAADVLEAGAEVGLHASTRAADDAQELARQRDRIAAACGGPVAGVRFHNLLLRVPDGLERVEEAGLEYDTTLGYAQRPGFRAGTSRPFSPYSRALGRALGVIEVPLAAMETTFLSARYLGVPAEEAFERTRAVLERVRSSGGAASLLWHNSSLDDPLTGGYGSVYARLLRWISDAGGAAVTVGEVATAYRERLSRARG